MILRTEESSNYYNKLGEYIMEECGGTQIIQAGDTWWIKLKPS